VACTVTVIGAVVATVSGRATWTASSASSTTGIAAPPSCILLSSPQFGNGVSNGHPALTKAVTVRVCEPAPPICTRSPIEKPASIQERPSSRVSELAVESISNPISSGVLPPPWTTVSPPCGPGQKTLRVVGLAMVGSAAPRSSRRVAPEPSIRRTRQAPSRPLIMTSWPSWKPSAVHDPPSVRVTEPPKSPPAIVIGTVAVTGTSPAVTTCTTTEIVRAEAPAGSAAPPVSPSAVGVAVCTVQLPARPLIVTRWPTVKPSASQSPAARVTVPPPAAGASVTGSGPVLENAE
jgi:hypothetical protein